MKEKKILIISRSFYPVNSPRSLRTTELARELARQGHDVTVLTPKSPEHAAFEKKHNLKIQDLGQPKWKEIKLSGKGLPLLFKRIVRRGLNLFFDYPNSEYYFKTKNALQKKKKDRESYDLLISIATPHPIHWGVASVWKKKNNLAKTWVADCGDPFMGQENDTFKKFFYFKYVEKWFCKKADFIAVPFEGAKKAYYVEFRSKIAVIPQGFEFPDHKNCNFSPKPNKPITFGYFGNILSYRHYASVFLENLNSINRDFKFVVYTNNREFYEEFLTENTLAKCEINDYLPRMELLSQFKDVNFLIHFPYLKGTQRSLKLIDYAFLNKPILSYTGDDQSAESFMEFLDFNFKNEMPKTDIEQYRIVNVAKQFLDLQVH